MRTAPPARSTCSTTPSFAIASRRAHKSMTRTHTLLLSSTLLAVCVLGFAPSSHALSLNASLGGNNALMRASAGGSQGVTRTNSASNLLVRLTFASTVGAPTETPPTDHPSNTGGNTSTDQSSGANGSTGSPQAGSNGD